MEKNVAIQVDKVSKRFKVFYDKGTSLKEKLLFRERNRYEVRTVLQNVSFDIKKGEAVGLVGKNGCGKSTMLKLLTKIMYPDGGSVKTTGRISALIELGAGFHPDMSGRENIYTNAAIFGLTRKEIDSRLEDIIAFSELGEYIDNPVRTYSSGMYMRLAFSVAINVDADILLIDEILAVGDAAFQAKCFNKLREIKAAGTTIVIVSHSLGQIEQFCDRSIWICDGAIRMEGTPRDVHPVYLDYMARQSMTTLDKNEEPQEEEPQNEEPASEQAEPAAGQTQPQACEQPSKNRWGSGDACFTRVRLLNAQGKETDRFLTGEKMDIVMEYTVKKPLKNPVCGIGIFRNDGLQCYGTNTQIDRLEALDLGTGGEIVVSLERNLLLQGEYTLDVALHEEGGFAYDYYRFAKSFQMYSDVQDVGAARIPHQWNVKTK